MQTQTLDLLAAAPGVRHSLRVLRFGTPGSGPKACIQAALHADEVPGMLVIEQLRLRLIALEAADALRGEVLLLPWANPLGLAQQLLGQHQGRFDLSDGLNFNRHHADLAQAAGDALEGRLGADPARNQALARQALTEAAAALTALQPAQDLKNRLLQLAIDSDVVLDLHCDVQSVMHLYGLTPQADLAAELGALLGAQAVLLATESGDQPFDEACTRPWLLLQQRFAAYPLPLGCFGVTVELRGACDTDHGLAARDADAILAFLRRRGFFGAATEGSVPPLPSPLCQPTPLAGAETITAPRAGVLVFHREPGERVEPGDLIADVFDPDSGETVPLRCRSGGVLFARCASRWAAPGQRLAQIAGELPIKTGKLLGP